MSSIRAGRGRRRAAVLTLLCALAGTLVIVSWSGAARTQNGPPGQPTGTFKIKNSIGRRCTPGKCSIEMVFGSSTGGAAFNSIVEIGDAALILSLCRSLTEPPGTNVGNSETGFRDYQAYSPALAASVKVTTTCTTSKALAENIPVTVSLSNTDGRSPSGTLKSVGGGGGAVACVVPNVVTLQFDTAVAKIKRALCALGRVRSVLHPGPPGRIVSQRPAAGVRLPLGSAVDVVLSYQAARCRVPNLVRLPLRAVFHPLLKGGCSLGTVSVRPSNLAPGSVAAQTPQAGVTRALNFPVAVTVSSGPKQNCVVPPVTGLMLGAAESALKRAGCALGSKTRAAAKGVAAGTVLVQRPVVGTVLPPGGRVDVVVSSG